MIRAAIVTTQMKIFRMYRHEQQAQVADFYTHRQQFDTIHKSRIAFGGSID